MPYLLFVGRHARITNIFEKRNLFVSPQNSPSLPNTNGFGYSDTAPIHTPVLSLRALKISCHVQEQSLSRGTRRIRRTTCRTEGMIWGFLTIKLSICWGMSNVKDDWPSTAVRLFGRSNHLCQHCPRLGQKRLL